MEFIDKKRVEASSEAKTGFYPNLPRRQELVDALKWCVTDYYIKASAGQPFEARGILVTGESRVGKTRETRNLLEKLKEGPNIMPDGRPARIVSCELAGSVSWKDLGIKTLEALNYPIDGRRTQTYIWGEVVNQARQQGVIGIHFDECQHVFTEKNSRTNEIFLDSFKTLLKDSRWPLILILSGVPILAKYIQEYEQLAHLLRPVHFDLIDLRKDAHELNRLVYSYADAVGISFAQLSHAEFFKRLLCACINRWGLVIELVVEAFALAKLEGAQSCSLDHFVSAFVKTYRLPPAYSPFTVVDFEEAFNPEVMASLLHKEQ